MLDDLNRRLADHQLRHRPVVTVAFLFGVTSTVACLFLGLLFANWYVRRQKAPAATTWQRSLHTGSVNDYAADPIEQRSEEPTSELESPRPW